MANLASLEINYAETWGAALSLVQPHLVFLPSGVASCVSVDGNDWTGFRKLLFSSLPLLIMNAELWERSQGDSAVLGHRSQPSLINSVAPTWAGSAPRRKVFNRENMWGPRDDNPKLHIKIALWEHVSLAFNERLLRQGLSFPPEAHMCTEWAGKDEYDIKWKNWVFT